MSESDFTDDSSSADTVSRRDFAIFSGGLATGTTLSVGVSQFGELSEGESDRIITSNRPLIGNTSAPITLVYWGDFQCPFCQRFDSNTLPQIKSEYIDSGDIRLVYKPLSLFDDGNNFPDSLQSAKSVYAVWDSIDRNSEVMYTWMNVLSERFSGTRGSGWASDENLRQYASNTDGVSPSDIELITERSSTYLDYISSDYTEGQGYGLSGTPFFVMYTTGNPEQNVTLSGAQPFIQFSSAYSQLQSED